MRKSDYSEKEKEYQSNLLRNGFFGEDVGLGYWHIDNKTIAPQLRFILDPASSCRNLFDSIRKEALEYFERYDIAWWRQYEDCYFPTGHLLSSQIHCLNHLFAIRKNPEAVLAMIQPIGTAAGISFDKVLPSFLDTKEAYFDKISGKPISNSNYISFEFVCHNIEMLEESHEKRGAKCTSIDAFIYAQAGRERWLIPIEWKYTESYDHCDDAYSFERYKKYVTTNSRLSKWSDLYRHEPFFELGRQTLLMEQLIKQKPLVGKISNKYPQRPLKADNFLHIIVVPTGNCLMRKDAEAFRSSLKDCYQNLFRIIDPKELINNILETIAVR